MYSHAKHCTNEMQHEKQTEKMDTKLIINMENRLVKNDEFDDFIHSNCANKSFVYKAFRKSSNH